MLNNDITVMLISVNQKLSGYKYNISILISYTYTEINLSKANTNSSLHVYSKRVNIKYRFKSLSPPHNMDTQGLKMAIDYITARNPLTFCKAKVSF